MTLTATEAALAGLLRDIGTLIRRGHDHATTPPTPPRASAAWSDAFFAWTDQERLAWPADVSRQRVRDATTFHHPVEPAHWLLAEADRMAAGLDHTSRAAADPRPDDVRRASLLSAMARVDIGRGAPPSGSHAVPALALSPSAMMPHPPEPDLQPARYTALWRAFQDGWRRIVAVPGLNGARLELALLGLSWQLLWAVPSPARDQPDIALHDHARTVAAIAACLALHHAAAGDDGDERAIRDPNRRKFRFIELDVSGIQRALLRSRSEQARGMARILRARSFLIGATLDGAVLQLRRLLGLPASCVLLSAGGRARLLAPALPQIDAHVAAFSAQLDRWLVDRWQGDLALPVAVGPAFAGKDFAPAAFWRAEAEAASALDAAKQRPLAGFGTGILRQVVFQAHGQCATCGARPAECPDRNEPDLFRCRACDEAHRLGQALPRAAGVALLPARGAPSAEVSLPGDLALMTRLPEQAAAAWVELGLDSVQDAFDRAAMPLPRPHVPRITDAADPRYGGLEENEAGGIKTFGHIAADALEAAPGRGLVGRRLLAVLKADVDRLGIVFSHGLLRAGRTPARVAQLSRLMDGFFGVCLPDLLRARFPDTYTVYAGGDDLLLVCPWRLGAPLALALRRAFGDFSANNPNLTLSAGLAFVSAEQPLNRAVGEAGEMLDMAKDSGRDRVGLLGRALTWDRLNATLDLGERVLAVLRDGHLPRGVLHTARDLMRERARAEAGDATTGLWWPRWRYSRRRFEERLKDKDDAARAALAPVLDDLLPPPGMTASADAELAATFALWRDR